MRRSNFALPLLASALVIGNPLMGCDDEGVTSGAAGTTPTEDPLPTADPLLTVAGTLSSDPLEAPPEGALEVGVLWLNLLEGEGTVLIETTAVDPVGSTLPASFDVSVLTPPSEVMLGTTLLTYGPDGSQQAFDPQRVAFGVVVVAPEGTFAALPESAALSEFIASSEATPGPLLSQFTLVSSYAVRYVVGASADGLTLRDIQGIESPLLDFTVFDLAAWARGIENAVCRDRRLGEGWQAPEVLSCIEGQAEALAEADAAQRACLEACAPSGADSSDCAVTCYLTYNGRQAIENGCLYAWSEANADATEAACGPRPDFAESDFRSAPRLAPDDTLDLTLGEGDIRKALTHGGFIFIN